MCGIAGFSGSFDASLLERMGLAIAHRGPDDSGIWWDGDAGLGLVHRRLSIIDLSSAGHQPMWDHHRKSVITYNGELYNYRELRDELVADGFVFDSDSDTEVLLNLYLRDGEDMLPRLNGIFAFAIWDTRRNALFLARDALGVKPFYFAQTPEGFLFASEIKALLQSPAVSREIDPRAIQSHLLHIWCHSPHTMLKAVRKLEPGCALRVRDGRIEKRWRHYDLPYDEPIQPMSESDAIHQLREQLRQSVTRQMVSDVPVGAFLSGGLDSSSVVAMAREATPDKRLQCFTIGFQDPVAEKEGMALDRPYAERVAKHLDVDLHTIWVGPNMVNELPRMLYHLDEAQSDPAPINALLICQLARQHDIKVLLSGAGGDDIFTGYRRHFALMQERYWSWLPTWAREGLRAAADRLPRSPETMRRIAKAFEYANLDGEERIASYFNWVHPRYVEQVLHPDLIGASGAEQSPLIAALSGLPEHVDPLTRMLYLEGRFFLADHNLNYTDKMSMACGVEVRVPLLDPDLVAFAARIPIPLKQKGRVGKWIFKRAMEDTLPHDVIYRPKTGFGAPLRNWLRQPLRPVVDEVLSEGSLARRGLFDPAGVRELVALDRSGRIDAAYMIFGIMCIELWCRMFIDPPTPTLQGVDSLGDLC